MSTLRRVDVLQVVVDDRILAEYRDVLAREAFGRYFSKPDREGILDYLDNNALRIAPRLVLPPLPDPGDTPFLEVALSEEVPLVTGNARHFPPESGETARCSVRGSSCAGMSPPESGVE